MDVRSEILRAARRLFAARGFDGTSLQSICDAVGIRKASLLYHFGSKEELRQRVLAEVLDRWNDVLPRLLLAAAAGEPRFGAVLRELVAFFTADPDRARLLVREILDRPDDMRSRLETYVQPWVDVVADLIRKGQQQGDLHDDVDPEAYVLQVINLVVSGVAMAASLAGALLPADAPQGAPERRHNRELIRIARSSLFRPGRAARAATSSAPSPAAAPQRRNADEEPPAADAVDTRPPPRPAARSDNPPKPAPAGDEESTP